MRTIKQYWLALEDLGALEFTLDGVHIAQLRTPIIVDKDKFANEFLKEKNITPTQIYLTGMLETSSRYIVSEIQLQSDGDYDFRIMTFVNGTNKVFYFYLVRTNRTLYNILYSVTPAYGNGSKNWQLLAQCECQSIARKLLFDLYQTTKDRSSVERLGGSEDYKWNSFSMTNFYGAIWEGKIEEVEANRLPAKYA